MFNNEVLLLTSYSDTNIIKTVIILGSFWLGHCFWMSVIKYSVRVIPTESASSMSLRLTWLGILRVKAVIAPVGSLGGRPTFLFKGCDIWRY